MIHPKPESLTVDLAGADQTRDLARRLGEKLAGGEAIALIGELGAGKTTFVQGLAQGLGLGPETAVTSPSYVLIVTHEGGRFELNHVDLYRLAPEEVDELGLEELFSPGGVTAVEWAERAPGGLPSERIEINLSWIGPAQRRAVIRGRGEAAKRIVGLLADEIREGKG